MPLSWYGAPGRRNRGDERPYGLRSVEELASEDEWVRLLYCPDEDNSLVNVANAEVLSET